MYEIVVERAAAKACRYLSQVLHTGLFSNVVEANMCGLPRFLSGWYDCATAELAGRCFIFVEAKGTHAVSATGVARHMAIIAENFRASAILVLPQVTKPGHHRLIENRVAFIVPGSHVYVPELAIVLSDAFAPLQKIYRLGRTPGSYGAVAQMLIIREALREEPYPETTTHIAGGFWLNAATIANAAKELIEDGMVTRADSGSQRPLVYSLHGRSLFDAAMGRLDQPVVERHHFVGAADLAGLLLSGESALSRMSMLATPRVPVFATNVREFRGLALRHKLAECDEADADVLVEVWRYDPQALSSGQCVDPLSLYLCLKDHRDERVAMCSEEMLSATLPLTEVM